MTESHGTPGAESRFSGFLPPQIAVLESFARVAAACCDAEVGMIAVREHDSFAIAAMFGLRGQAPRLRGIRMFEETIRLDRVIEAVDRDDTAVNRAYRFYAGLPIRMPSGLVIGVLAVLDAAPHALNDRQRGQLRSIAEGIGRFALLRFPDPPEPALRRARALTQHAQDAMLVYQIPSPGSIPRIVYANPAFTRTFDFALEEIIGQTDGFLRGAATGSQTLEQLRDAIVAAHPMRTRLSLYRKQSTAQKFDIDGFPVNGDHGNFALWVATFRPALVDSVTTSGFTTSVTDESGAASVGGASGEGDTDRYRRTLASMSDAVVTVDENGTVIFLNVAARALLDVGEEPGAAAREGLLGLRDIENEGVLTTPFTAAEAIKARALVMTRSGIRRYVEYAVAPITQDDARVDGFVVVLRDVTAEEVLTRRLSFEASHDPLTGLANRRRFEQALARAINGAQTEQQQHTLAFLDLDQFKAINDKCGHAAGDQVLREIASVFKAQLRGHDVIARFGGDEFAILMHDCSPRTALRVVHRIRAAMSVYRWRWEHREFTLGVSVGLAEITQSTRDAEAALREADTAAYADKLERKHIPTVNGTVHAPPVPDVPQNV